MPSNNIYVLSRCAECCGITRCRGFSPRQLLREKLLAIEKRMEPLYGYSYHAYRIYVCDSCAPQVKR